jgi:hypothetical protein
MIEIQETDVAARPETLSCLAQRVDVVFGKNENTLGVTADDFLVDRDRSLHESNRHR